MCVNLSRSSALLEAVELDGVPLVCPLIILPEVAGAVRRTWNDGLRGRLAAQLVSEMPNMTLVLLDRTFTEMAVNVAADYGIRGMDAIYVAVAHQSDCPLVTLDDDIQRRAGSFITVLRPAQALASLRPAASPGG